MFLQHSKSEFWLTRLPMVLAVLRTCGCGRVWSGSGAERGNGACLRTNKAPRLRSHARAECGTLVWGGSRGTRPPRCSTCHSGATVFLGNCEKPMCWKTNIPAMSSRTRVDGTRSRNGPRSQPHPSTLHTLLRTHNQNTPFKTERETEREGKM